PGARGGLYPGEPPPPQPAPRPAARSRAWARRPEPGTGRGPGSPAPGRSLRARREGTERPPPHPTLRPTTPFWLEGPESRSGPGGDLQVAAGVATPRHRGRPPYFRPGRTAAGRGARSGPHGGPDFSGETDAGRGQGPWATPGGDRGRRPAAPCARSPVLHCLAAGLGRRPGLSREQSHWGHTPSGSSSAPQRLSSRGADRGAARGLRTELLSALCCVV
ncbi:PREDICTED: translation initiation factor IF-2-like, partial [Chinchilla lanigera]|uniref:translation initiation factor IF-2-like n=1 Tax=Chinchilla lanigera TaxID=34839 RepID=UPI000696417D